VAKAGDKKIMVIVIILFAVAFGVIAALCYYKWVDNRDKEKEIIEIAGKIKDQVKIRDKIPELRKKKSQRIEAINSLTKILPTETMASHQEFLYLLQTFAKTAGVTVKSMLAPKEMPPELNLKRYKYTILVGGTFAQFVRFLSQIERHTRFFKVDSFEMTNEAAGMVWPATSDKKIRLEITTYTYKP
jgi:Tfp pilus assembly protein PilO